MVSNARHIVIADDHSGVLQALVRVVQQIYPSALITTVANGAEALTTYLHHGADLLITDGHMPVMGGIELIRALRAQQATLPILLISFDMTLNVAGLAAAVESTDVPVIASGGVGTLDDVRALAAIRGLHGIITGRALYEGRFTVADAVAVLS